MTLLPKKSLFSFCIVRARREGEGRHGILTMQQFDENEQLLKEEKTQVFLLTKCKMKAISKFVAVQIKYFRKKNHAFDIQLRCFS